MQTVRIQTTIGVPIERGFAAWTEAEHLSRWFTERTEIDLRIGGHYSNSDGDRGTFLLIRPNSRLQFTWENPDHAPGTMVEIEFSRLDDLRHTVSLVHSGLRSEAEAGDMETGWSWGLASLRSYLESGRPIPYDEWKREHKGEKGNEQTEPVKGSAI